MVREVRKLGEEGNAKEGARQMKKELISLAMATLATVAAWALVVACCEPDLIKAMQVWE